MQGTRYPRVRFRDDLFPRKWTSLAAGALALTTAFSADAHGRFPGATGVAFDSSAPEHALVRMTYGFYDNAAPADADPALGWRWLCPNALGFDAAKEDPAFVLAGSSLLVGTFDGLVASTADRCGYELLEPMKGHYVVGLAALPSTVAPAPGSPLLALASNGTGADAFDVRLYERASGATDWKQVVTTLPEDFLAISVTAAPAKDEPLGWGSIYLSGRDGTVDGGYEAVVMRSDDGGATWSRFVVPGLDGLVGLPYLQAASPSAPSTVFVAAVRDEAPTYAQSNLVSRDGGATWTSYFDAEERLPGFALSPDGKKVAFGGEKTGLMVAPVASLEEAGAAEKRQALRVACASWTESGLYVCGNAFVDGFAVGRSEDEGESFTPFTTLTAACGALECAEGTPVADTCGPLWAVEAAELVAPATCTPEPEPPVVEDGCRAVPGAVDASSRLAAGWVALAALGVAARRRRRG